ncbi:MAG: LysR family transcriptional regulator [Nitrospira sp.]|nr:LysR family transcriptional regulator [bacterium]MBL7049644.1 LysR family transcriptional regulator [Nitrospira sp.]
MCYLITTDMDIKLKIFCTVAETKSVTRASRIVHLSQPAVTLQIQALEAFFETKLFDKTKGQGSLTPAGEILYEHARHILTHYAEVEKDINKITGMMKGAVTLGASTTLGSYILPYVITDFKKIHPKIKIKMYSGNTERIEDLLASGFIDFGIIAGKTSKRNITSEQVLVDQLSLIVHPKHPLARKKTASILDLTNEPFILREEGSGTLQTIEKFLKTHGVSKRDLHVALILGSTESIKASVETGTGIALVSKWAVRKEVQDGRIKIVNLKEGSIPRALSFIFPQKAQMSHADKEFVLFIKNYPFDSL